MHYPCPDGRDASKIPRFDFDFHAAFDRQWQRDANACGGETEDDPPPTVRRGHAGRANDAPLQDAVSRRGAEIDGLHGMHEVGIGSRKHGDLVVNAIQPVTDGI
jgi:hypothetical protein